MTYRYRTIVFEFAKDGILGERYIDDEEMEKTLNSQGRLGWELVSVVMIQDGVLAVLKRPGSPQKGDAVQTEALQEREPDESKEEQEEGTFSTAQIQAEEREHIQALEKQRQQKMKKFDQDHFGDIKIS